jgi:tRNA pseudouridine55 synthase
VSAAGAYLDGLLVIDKPAGWTSHDVVARVRRLTGLRRTGHAGTLDPLATGVLPVGIGQGTRILHYLSDSGKSYRARIRFGVTTDTFDSEGQVTAEKPTTGLTAESITRALAAFRGIYVQRAPIYSAIKREGKPLHRYARAGMSVEVPLRRVQVDHLELIAFNRPEAELEIDCGSGFYVRSLANDLGQALGCGAHLQDLRRTRAGPFQEADAITLERLSDAIQSSEIYSLLHPLDTPLLDKPALILAAAHAADVTEGRSLKLEGRGNRAAGELCRAYSADGELLALLVLDEDGARPRRVFPPGHRGPNIEQASMRLYGKD